MSEKDLEKTRVALEKAKITFNEAKDMLRSSKLNAEQLEHKISRFVAICVPSIAALTTALSFLKDGNSFFKVGLLALIIGFIHSLFKTIQSQKTNQYASDGIEARTIINDKNIRKKDEIFLMQSLSLTYEDKAKHNNDVTTKIAKSFDGVLKNLEKYLFISSIFMFIGFFTP